MAPPPPYLMPELIGEILVRFPPDEPACLLRASLVCKLWRHILCDDQAFRHRYVAFHRAPPLLGFLYNHTFNDHGKYFSVTHFVSTITPSPLPLQAFEDPYYYAWRILDCRHGRILLNAPAVDVSSHFAVWDSATGKHKELPVPPSRQERNYHYFCNAAVLCAVPGCDHLNCHGGPFVVVFVCSNPMVEVLQSHMYSSETSTWSCSEFLGHRFMTVRRPSVCIGNHIYFILVTRPNIRIAILDIDLRNSHLCIINSPEVHDFRGNAVLMATEDGSLGLAVILGRSRLCLWSRNVVVNSEVAGGWAPCTTIELQTLVPYKYKLRVAGSAEGTGLISVDSDVGVFSLDVKSGRERKVDEPREGIISIFSFTSFYIPVMAPASESEHSVFPEGEQNSILRRSTRSRRSKPSTRWPREEWIA